MEFPWGPIHYLTFGQGRPLLVLHGERDAQVNPELLDRLSGSFTVVVPTLPGFPPSAVPPWMRSTTEMASVMNWFLRRLEIGPVDAVGFGFGGWVLAEMAVQSPPSFSRLVLQAPVGVRPEPGEEILDRYVFTDEKYVALGFAKNGADSELVESPDDAQLRSWDAAREMTTRVAYKPYMFNPALPHLLPGVSCPTLVIWGDGDRLVPRSCAERYVAGVSGASLAIVPGGHWLDLEAASQLHDLVVDFMSGQDASAPR
jgi:pimeloyl-ACP methyl ester carboxylesterase